MFFIEKPTACSKTAAVIDDALVAAGLGTDHSIALRQRIFQRGRCLIGHPLPSTQGKRETFGCFFHIIEADNLISIRLLEQGP